MVTNTFEDFSLLADERASGVSSLVDAGLWPDAAPALRDWAAHTQLSTVRRQTALLAHVVNVIAQATHSKYDSTNIFKCGSICLMRKLIIFRSS